MGSVQRTVEHARAGEGTCSAAADSCRGSLPAYPERRPAAGAITHDPEAPGNVARIAVDNPASAGSSARVSLRRLRRLHLLGFASHAPEEGGPADRGARTPGGGRRQGGSSG